MHNVHQSIIPKESKSVNEYHRAHSQIQPIRFWQSFWQVFDLKRNTIASEGALNMAYSINWSNELKKRCHESFLSDIRYFIRKYPYIWRESHTFKTRKASPWMPKVLNRSNSLSSKTSKSILSSKRRTKGVFKVYPVSFCKFPLFQQLTLVYSLSWWLVESGLLNPFSQGQNWKSVNNFRQLSNMSLK